MLLFWVHPPCGCPTVHEEISDGVVYFGMVAQPLDFYMDCRRECHCVEISVLVSQ